MDGILKCPKTTPALDALSDIHKLFVREYFKTFNAARTAVSIGLSYDAAWDIVHRPDVSAAIAEAMDRLGITPERIESEIAEIAFSNDVADLEGVFTGERLSDLRRKGVPTKLIRKIKATRRMVRSDDNPDRWEPVEDITIESHDRLKALELLGKVRAMYPSTPDGASTTSINLTLVQAVIDNMPEMRLAFPGALPLAQGDTHVSDAPQASPDGDRASSANVEPRK